MSLNNSIVTQSIGIPYQQYVTSSAGYTLISSSTYFNDTSDNLPRYKDARGTILVPMISSSYAQTSSYANSFSINGSSRVLYTSCSLVYSGSNVTQVTQSFGSTQQITNIIYSGSFADGNPLSIAVTGSDGINKLYTLTYSASLVTQIIQS